ncbi:MAG: hypothetical protein OXD46_05470 [Chloroflexi bacterium]|nr:hypothetical protein [Chloroflexota bacterium]
MEISEAKLELDMAYRNLQGCESYLSQTSAAYRDAQAASGSNERHYRLRRIHGDNYRLKLEDQWKSALQQFKDADARLNRAREKYKEAVQNGQDAP